MSTTSRTIRWIESLADQENLIRAGEKVSIDLGATKQDVLAGETVSFVHDLYYHCDYLVTLFNGRVAQRELQLRLSRGESLDHFSILRNSFALAVWTPQPGITQLQCDKSASDPVSRGAKASMMFSGRVEAKFGAFHDVEWFFLGNRVNAELLARHYLTEFIQVSRGEPARY